MNDDDAMRRAIEICRRGIDHGQSPFGAVIVKDGQIVAERHNSVWKDGDPTAHAEVNALRLAASELKTFDLSGCTLYSTCEPCPMCLAATHWAKVDRVVFGATIADAQKAGFTEMPIPAADLARMGGSRLKVEGGLLQDECAALFEEWKRGGRSGAY